MKKYLIVFVCLLGQPAKAEVKISDLAILDLIGKFEAPKGYDQYYIGAKRPPPKKLTSMTVGEVLKWQVNLRALGSKSTASGRYQIIYKTLLGLKNSGKIKSSDLFNAQNQNNLALKLMTPCLAYRQNTAVAEFGNCLAKIWAAFPIHTGSKRGRSYYHNVAGNRAQVSITDVEKYLEGTIKLASVAKAPNKKYTARSATSSTSSGYKAIPDQYLLAGYKFVTKRTLINLAAEKAKLSNTLGKSIRVKVYSRDPYQTN